MTYPEKQNPTEVGLCRDSTARFTASAIPKEEELK